MLHTNHIDAPYKTQRQTSPASRRKIYTKRLMKVSRRIPSSNLLYQWSRRHLSGQPFSAFGGRRIAAEITQGSQEVKGCPSLLDGRTTRRDCLIYASSLKNPNFPFFHHSFHTHFTKITSSPSIREIHREPLHQKRCRARSNQDSGTG